MVVVLKYIRAWKHGCVLLRLYSVAIPKHLATQTNEDDRRPNENSIYPAIKLKYPPHSWGKMEPSYAWLWQQHMENSINIADVEKRKTALCEQLMQHEKFRVIDKKPRVLTFKQYMTKTCIVNTLPEVYTTADSSMLDDLTKTCAPLIYDFILAKIENFKIKQSTFEDFRYIPTEMVGENLLSIPRMYDERKDLSNSILRGIISIVLEQVSAKHLYMSTALLDENVMISAFWDRHGIERKRKRMLHPEYNWPAKYKMTTVNDKRISAKCHADFVLRTDLPLPEFADRNQKPCVGGDVPELKYKPIVFGQRAEPIAFAKRTIVAGHKWGDPCEFGHLAMLNTTWTDDMVVKFGSKYAQDAVIGQAIGTGFVWLVAQAYDQGFNTFLDLTYPLTTQILLTDGQMWQPVAYQLNTLHLWKDDEGNPRNNVCWLGDKVQLYECVKDDAVQGFNADALRPIIACVAMSPSPRSYSMRPTLPPNAHNPQLAKEYIAEYVEEVVVEEEERYEIE